MIMRTFETYNLILNRIARNLLNSILKNVETFVNYK